MTSRIYKLRGGSATTEKVIITPEDDTILQNAFKNIKSNRNGNELTKNSILSYTGKIQKLAILATGKPFTDYKFLLDTTNIIKLIDTHILKSSKDYYSSIVKLLKSIEKVPKNVLDIYAEKMKQTKTTEDTVRGDNIIPDSHKKRLAGLSLESIKEKIINYKPEDDMDYIYQLICAFYWLNDFTPRNDLYSFKLRASTNKKPYNPEFNYIVMTSDKTPRKIVMCYYKTSATYGKQEFDISPELTTYLKSYLENYGKQPGDFLFVDKNNNQFKFSNFNNLIIKSMSEVIGSDLNIDLIRQYKLTNIFSTSPNMTINQRNELARNYLHSSATALEYNRPEMLSI